jgi:hypothetical protein
LISNIRCRRKDPKLILHESLESYRDKKKREQRLEASTNKTHRRSEVTGKTNRYLVGVAEEGYNKHYEEWQRQR